MAGDGHVVASGRRAVNRAQEFVQAAPGPWAIGAFPTVSNTCGHSDNNHHNPLITNSQSPTHQRVQIDGTGIAQRTMTTPLKT
jgi:hypothetical protein